MSLAAGVLAVSACSGDDNSADDTSAPSSPHESAPASTEPADTEVATTTPRPATTEPPVITQMTTTTTVAPTTTVVDEEALKAQIAEDYNAAYQLREEMYSAPTLDGLEERLALVAAPGSRSYTAFEEFIRDLVGTGERLAPNSPDYSTVSAQKVELSGDAPYSEALVTGCLVTNQIRVDSDGNTVEGGGLGASQRVEVLVLTANGWLPAEPLTQENVVPEATECPPA